MIAFLAAENENRQLGDLPQADFDYVPERFLSDKVNNLEFCISKITPIVVFQHIFSS